MLTFDDGVTIDSKYTIARILTNALSLNLHDGNVILGKIVSVSLQYGQIDGQRKDYEKCRHRHHVHKVTVQVHTCDSRNQERDIGPRHFSITEPIAYIPMPISTKTVAQAIKDTESEP